MPIGTLTRKGQTTIPKAVRQHLGLEPGDGIRFVIDGKGRVILMPAKKVRLKDLYGMVPAPSAPVPVEAMNDAVADAAVERLEKAARER